MLRTSERPFHNTLYLWRLGRPGIHPQHEHAFWKRRTEEMFGRGIAAKCTKDDSWEVFQLHFQYSEKLRHALLHCKKVSTDDISSLTFDCNIGDGSLLTELADIILQKIIESLTAQNLFSTNFPVKELKRVPKQILKRHSNELLTIYSHRQSIPFMPKNLVTYYTPRLGRNEVYFCEILSSENRHGRYLLDPDTCKKNPLIEFAKSGDIESLSTEFKKLGDDAKIVCFVTRDKLSQFNLLDAAVYSGSLPCVELIIQIAGDNILALCQNTLDFYAQMSGSISCLKRIFELREEDFHQQLLPEDSHMLYRKNDAFHNAIVRQDLPVLNFYLTWLKDHDMLHFVSSRYIRDDNEPNIHQLEDLFWRPTSGAMFNLLDQYMNFDLDSPVIQYVQNYLYRLSFTTRCIVQLKLDQLQNAKENMASTFPTITRK